MSLFHGLCSLNASFFTFGLYVFFVFFFVLFSLFCEFISLFCAFSSFSASFCRISVVLSAKFSVCFSSTFSTFCAQRSSTSFSPDSIVGSCFFSEGTSSSSPSKAQYPPNGKARIENFSPFFFVLEYIAGPNPIENSLISNFKSFPAI